MATIGREIAIELLPTVGNPVGDSDNGFTAAANLRTDIYSRDFCLRISAKVIRSKSELRIELVIPESLSYADY